MATALSVSEPQAYDLTSARQFMSGILFIDPTVEDYQSLVTGVVAGTEVVILDAQCDGVEQISEVLAERRNLSSLHIVSHGRPGSVQLGTAQLGLETLDHYAGTIQGWADALVDKADILLYGCEVAAGEQGAAFVQQLSRLTGTHVAASTNRTGSAALGGDWELETTTGAMKTSLAFQPEAMATYSFVLATSLVSVSSSGTQGNQDSFYPAISADGRYVAFFSEASNLVSGDTNDDTRDIFVHDRQTGSTSLVSVSSSGTKGNSDSSGPAISADGRYVAFFSNASNLVSGDTNNTSDVFVHDRQTGSTSRVSASSSGTQGNDFSDAPSISADGRYVAFVSGASNLVSGDTNNTSDVFVHDRQTGSTNRVSVSSSGTQGNDFSGGPSISADGRYVAFGSTATNLVSGDTNDAPDVFVHDRQTGSTNRVSVSSSGTQGNDFSGGPSISADGRYVAFVSSARNLVSGDISNIISVDVFVHDRQTGSTSRVSASSAVSSISADGRYVAFTSRASLVSGDTNNTYDIFVHDRQTGSTSRVSVSSDGTQGNNHSVFQSSISADGRYVAFYSDASNLVSGDTNNTGDIFVSDTFDLPVAPDIQTDILWRYQGAGPAQGVNVLWQMDGITHTSSTRLESVENLNWQVVGTDDFTGDGQTDILWRYQGAGPAQGVNVLWSLNGRTPSDTSGTRLETVTDLNWQVVGTGEFTGDSQTDILWRYQGAGPAQGVNVLWQMNGTTHTSSTRLETVTDLNWQVAGVGDFTGI